MCKRALVNKIIPFSMVDGPGNRTSIFFQGCDFTCRYCHNPETQRICVNCGACVEVCPTGALSIEEERNIVSWDEKKCVSCDKCIAECKNNSTPKTMMLSADEIMERIKTALPFIEGITVSGGECTKYSDFLPELFKKVKELGKTCFVDSNGQKDFQEDCMKPLLDMTDKVMLDVKSIDENEHKMLTGSSNEIVIRNLEFLAKQDKLFEVRTVIVPEFLNNEKTVRDVSQILKNYPDVRYKLIKFRHWGVRPPMDVREPDDAYMNSLKDIAQSIGVKDIVIT